VAAPVFLQERGPPHILEESMGRPPEEKVVVGYLSPSMSHSAFRESLLDLIVYDVAYHRRIVDGGGRLSIRAGSNLSAPRNALVRQFLAYGKADWLWIVDSDMTFPPDTLERLLEHADPDKAPIVGGLCFGYDEHGDVQPTLFGLVADDDSDEPQVIRYHEWPPDAMFQVAATGAACLLVHKSVLEAIRDAEIPSRGGRRGFNDAFPWFQETEHDGSPVGEDFTFCWRAGLLGIPVYIDTSVQLGHVKDYELTMDVYLARRNEREDTSLAAVFKGPEKS
jgi:glycosyl transferase family 2